MIFLNSVSYTLPSQYLTWLKDDGYIHKCKVRLLYPPYSVKEIVKGLGYEVVFDIH